MPSIFDGYPYCNTHTLNLDWVIKKIQEAQKTLDDVQALVGELEGVNDVLASAQQAAAAAARAAEEAKNAAATISTDKTLTMSGVPADAKAVGDTTINGKALRTNPVISADDIGAAKVTNTINGKTLGSNPVLVPGDIGAASANNTVNGIPISENPVLTGTDFGLLTFEQDPGHPSSYYEVDVSERHRYLNPPLKMDVQYMLMDMYNGQPVYTKRFNIGECPVDGGRAFQHGIDGCTPISIEAVTTNTKYTLPFISSASNKGIFISATPTVINIYSSLTSSNHGDVIVTMKYCLPE